MMKRVKLQYLRIKNNSFLMDIRYTGVFYLGRLVNLHRPLVSRSEGTGWCFFMVAMLICCKDLSSDDAERQETVHRSIKAFVGSIAIDLNRVFHYSTTIHLLSPPTSGLGKPSTDG
jgi:hypothetical protein